MIISNLISIASIVISLVALIIILINSKRYHGMIKSLSLKKQTPYILFLGDMEDEDFKAFSEAFRSVYDPKEYICIITNSKEPRVVEFAS